MKLKKTIEDLVYALDIVGAARKQQVAKIGLSPQRYDELRMELDEAAHGCGCEACKTYLKSMNDGIFPVFQGIEVIKYDQLPDNRGVYLDTKNQVLGIIVIQTDAPFLTSQGATVH